MDYLHPADSAHPPGLGRWVAGGPSAETAEAETGKTDRNSLGCGRDQALGEEKADAGLNEALGVFVGVPGEQLCRYPGWGAADTA